MRRAGKMTEFCKIEKEVLVSGKDSRISRLTTVFMILLYARLNAAEMTIGRYIQKHTLFPSS